MNLIDIYTFLIQTYIKKNPETALLWLSSFDYYDQILFINLFVVHKMRILWKSYPKFNYNYKNNHKTNCECQSIYKEHLEPLMLGKTNNVWFLSKCINDDENTQKESPKTEIFTFNSKKQMTLYNNELLKYNAPKPINTIDLFSIDTKNYAVESTKTTTAAAANNLTLKQLENLSTNTIFLKDIIANLDVRELYVLLCPDIPSVRIFDLLLPEYLRVMGMRNRNRLLQNLNAEALLMNIYNFFNRQMLHQIDTQMKMTSILPKLKYINIPITDTTNDYFYQPRLSGIRLFICKTMQSNVIVMNENHMKINLNCGTIQNLKLDPINSYSAEFMLVLYNVETEEFTSKKELLKYLNFTTNYRNSYQVRLVLMDLYIWQSVNLMIDSYEKRYELFDKFIKYVKHNNTIIKIKNYENITSIYEHYNNYLNSFALESVITGVVYRKKTAVYESILQSINFTKLFQKHLIVSNYNTTIKVLHNKNTTETISGKCCILTPDCDCFMYCVCYNIIGNMLQLALFDVNVFRPFLNIVTDYSNNHYKVLFKHAKPIKVCGFIHPWIIVKIGFSHNYTKVEDIKFYPEKTLIDCSSRWFCI